MNRFSLSALSFVLFSSLAMADESRTTSYEYYEGTNKLKSEDGPRTDVNDVTTYTYTENGELKTVTNALGHTVQYLDHNAAGKPQKVIDENGVESVYQYDPWGNVTSISTAGREYKFSYTPNNQLEKIISPDGSWIQYQYTASMKIKSVLGSAGDITETQREMVDIGNGFKNRKTTTLIKDKDGNIVYQKSSLTDELGRIRQTIDALNNPVSNVKFDRNGNSIEVKDGLDRTNKHTFTLFDQLESVTDALQGKTTLTYDSQGNITSIKDPRGVTTEFKYNSFGDLVEKNSPDTGKVTYLYDAASNLIKDDKWTYHYDALNRLTHTSDGPREFTLNLDYDETKEGNHGVGRLTSIGTEKSSIHYKYDAFGNVTGLTQKVGNISQESEYAFDNNDNLLKLRYPSTLEVHFKRNLNGNIQKVELHHKTNVIEIIKDVSYLPFGVMDKVTFGNDLEIEREFDKNLQLKKQSLKGKGFTEYTYDLAGNITKKGNGSKEQSYTYDALNRVTEESSPDSNGSYTYDAAHNRTERNKDGVTDNYSFAEDSNKLSSVNGKDVIVSEKGRLTSDANQFEYEYDYNGRLAQSKINGQNQYLARYAYNPAGERVKKSLPNGTFSIFSYDEFGTLLSEQKYNSDSKLIKTRHYIWLDDIPVAIADLIGDEVTVYYIHVDHLNTPRKMSDNDGKLVWAWESDAYGVGNENQDVDGNGQLVNLNLRFPGQYKDDETGLFYNYYRYYNPNTGRYITSDPIGLAGGINTFAYVMGNPVNYVDPKGLHLEKLGAAIIAYRIMKYICKLNPKKCKNFKKCLKQPASCKKEFCKQRPNQFYHGDDNNGICEVPGCKDSDNSAGLMLKRAAAEGCVAMRQFVANVCHGGKYDKEHKKQLQDAKDKLDKCKRRCPSDPSSFF